MALTGVGALGRRVRGRGSRIVTRTVMPAAIETRQITEKAPVRPRKFIYGRTRAEGTMVFAHHTTERIALTATASLTAKVLHLVVAFADHEVTAFDEVLFDNEVVPLDADGEVTAGHRLSGWAWVTKHLGSDSQPADARLIAAAPDKWTAADRLRGVAYLYVRLVLISAKFPNRRPPNITAVIRGAKPFDPRSHTTAYSANAALCLRDYLYNRRFGLKAAALYSAGTASVTNGSPTVTGSGAAYLTNVLPGDQFDVVGDGVWYGVQSVDSDTQLTLSSNYAGTTAPGLAYAISTEVDEAGAVAAANICDQTVGLAAGGTEPRYEANGLLSSRDAPDDMVEAFRTAMAGELIQSGGKWLIKPGAYQTPVVSLGDDDLHDVPDAGVRGSRTDLFNRLRGVFISPDHLWQKTDLPPMTDAAFVSQDGGEDVEDSVFFPLTTSFAACQRIMRIMLRRVREQETVTLRVKTRGLSLRAGDTVKVTNGRMGWVEKVFRVLEIGIDVTADGFGATLSLVAETSSVHDWAAEEQVVAGIAVFVAEGTANGDKAFTLTTDDPITVGTTALTFAQFGGGGGVTAVTGSAPITSSGGSAPDIAISPATTGAAGSMSSADKTKLDGVATAANNYSHPNHTGDVTSSGDGAQTIANNAVTLAKMADMATASLLGRDTASTGDPEVLSAATARGILNVENGATADQTNAEIKTAYEANANTNEFNDAEQTKLAGIATGAEVNPAVVSQADAEAGTATDERIWTAQRVKQAIDALSSGSDNVARDNIMLNAFRIAINGGLSVLNMEDGIVDEFEDQIGVDTVTSTGETYDVAGDFYTNLATVNEGDLTPTASSMTDWGDNLANRKFMGLRFTASVAGSVQTAKIDVKDVTASIATAHAEIWTDSAGSPGVKVGGSSDNLAVSSTGLKTFSWSADKPSLSASTFYWLVLSDDSGGQITPDGDNSDGVVHGLADTITAISEDSNSVAGRTPAFEVSLQTGGDMTLQSAAFSATATPTDARIVVFEEDIVAVTINTDLKAYVSRDGGTTFTQITLADEGDFETGKQILAGSVDISAQPSGSSMKWKLTSHNNAELRIHGVALQWS